MTLNDHRVAVFDFGGVLVRTVDPRPRLDLARQLGLREGGLERTIFGSDAWHQAQLGRITLEEFWADVGHRLGLDLPAITRFRKQFWAGDRLDPQLFVLIRQLRKQGYYTLLLSNGPAAKYQELVELGVGNDFDEMVLSGREGVMKPDAAAFHIALERFGASAEDAIFVDDSRENVVAARELGMHSHLFRGLTPLRLWLQELGLSVPVAPVKPLEDIRAIIFDWAGVIEGSPDGAYFAAWEKRLGLEPGELPGILWGGLWHQVEIGVLSTEEFMRHLAKVLDLDGAQAAGDFVEEFYDGDWLYPEMVAAVRSLHGHYRVALLSNAFAEQDRWLRKMFGVDVEEDFDVYVNSARVGMRKPDPRIFQLTLRKLRVAPRQAILLDDSLRNVDAAGALGLHTVHVVEPALCLAELGALLGHSIGSSA